MSTHATLIIKNPDAANGPQSYGTTLVHFDGHPHKLGKDLVLFHTSHDQVRALLQAGGLDHIRGPVLGHHDFPDEDNATKWYPSEKEAFEAIKNGPGAYHYLWAGNRWLMLDDKGARLSIPRY